MPGRPFGVLTDRFHAAFTGAMLYRVLGPITLETSDGEGRRPGGKKARLLLAVLVSRWPRPVPADVLVEALWPGALPGDPYAALQTQVSRVRSLLAEADPGAGIAFEAGAYRITGEATSDAARLEDALARTRRAATPGESLALVREGLSGVRGRPYAEFDGVGALDAEIRRLSELVTSGREREVELLLALGRVDEARERAEPLVADEPLAERPRELLMEALYRSGRTADAVAVFQRFRTRLSEELGLDPSPGLRQLEIEILRHGDALRGTSPVPRDLADPARAPGGPASVARAVRGEPADPIDAPDLRIAFATGARGRIAYATAGTGPPLLVPPGWVNSLSSLGAGADPRSAFFARLARRFTLVLYDRLGMGLSAGDAAPFSAEREVAEARAVMDAAGLDRASILAISQAGPHAVRMAAEWPDRVRRLVLFGTYASGPRTYPREDVRTSMLALVRASWGLGSKVISDLIVPRATAEQARTFARLQRESATPERAAEALEHFYAADVTELLPRLRLPVLVLHYEGDRAVPVHGGRELATLTPSARLVLLQGSAHLPRPEDLDPIVEEVTAFLEAEEQPA